MKLRRCGSQMKRMPEGVGATGNESTLSGNQTDNLSVRKRASRVVNECVVLRLARKEGGMESGQGGRREE
ncbi:hypothetical protein Pmani_020774 [Petrolisthes manimaculis]|uniref:Uncharacterized protein n=1 Tax=Petrolisthes manimaculis TaxID=1843537 RepID=A0AAE1PI08_9EUCA|nr:hypothetical protein Pmani_020774 [Petrolisthes manimaculis]